MTTYYVDTVHGNNANNGLGPDASAVTNKPWKTIAKALGAAGIASGDTVYLSPSAYFREVVTVAMTSPTVETKILGDPWNNQGFKSAAGVRVLPGPVVWTAFLTNEATAPSTTALLNLAARNHLTFRNLLMFGANVANGSCVLATTASSSDILFEDCGLLPFHTRGIVSVTGTFGAAMNWTFNRCYFGPTAIANALTFTGPLGTGADYDTNVHVHNCIFASCGSSTAIIYTTSATGANKPGGLVITGNTFWGCRALLTGSTVATGSTVIVNDNIIVGLSNVGISAGAAGQITEDHNAIWSTIGDTSGTMTHGGHSVSGTNYALALNVASLDRLWSSLARRPWLEPLAPDTAIGSIALAGIGYSGVTTEPLDIEEYERALNPVVGAYGNRHNTWRRDPSTPFADDGSNLYNNVAGLVDFAYVIPTEVGFTYTISIDMEYDVLGGSGIKPYAVLMPNPRIAFAGETKNMTAGIATPETLTFTPFAPVNFEHDFVILRILDWNDGTRRTSAGNLTITRV